MIIQQNSAKETHRTFMHRAARRVTAVARGLATAAAAPKTVVVTRQIPAAGMERLREAERSGRIQVGPRGATCHTPELLFVAVLRCACGTSRTRPCRGKLC